MAANSQADGVWLLPYVSSVSIDASARAWIGTGTPSVTQERDEQVVHILGREESVTQSSGVVRLDVGTLDGALMSRHGLTADEWRARLEALVCNQSRYLRIACVTPRVYYWNLELGSKTFTHRIYGDPGWNVSVAFREKR